MDAPRILWRCPLCRPSPPTRYLSAVPREPILPRVTYLPLPQLWAHLREAHGWDRDEHRELVTAGWRKRAAGD